MRAPDTIAFPLWVKSQFIAVVYNRGSIKKIDFGFPTSKSIACGNVSCGQLTCPHCPCLLKILVRALLEWSRAGWCVVPQIGTRTTRRLSDTHHPKSRSPWFGTMGWTETRDVSIRPRTVGGGGSMARSAASRSLEGSLGICAALRRFRMRGDRNHGRSKRPAITHGSLDASWRTKKPAGHVGLAGFVCWDLVAGTGFEPVTFRL